MAPLPSRPGNPTHAASTTRDMHSTGWTERKGAIHGEKNLDHVQCSRCVTTREWHQFTTRPTPSLQNGRSLWRGQSALGRPPNPEG